MSLAKLAETSGWKFHPNWDLTSSAMQGRIVEETVVEYEIDKDGTLRITKVTVPGMGDVTQELPCSVLDELWEQAYAHASDML